jgi:AraC family transcriptional regulator
MDTRLSQGHFFGRVLDSHKVSDFLLNETLYFASANIPKHSHVNGYFCLVRQGSYTESYGAKARACGPHTFAFHPPGEVHSEQFDNVEARSFNIEFTPRWLNQIREKSIKLDGPIHFQGGPLTALAGKLYREFRLMDSVSHLAIQGLILEIVAETARRQHSVRNTKTPAWLSKVREILHEHFADGLEHNDIAAMVDVHPVHMATAFRKRYRCTIGEYVRQLRLEYACRELAHSDKPIAQIAIQAGYVDQSHLSRVLKNSVGLTPAEYRSNLRLN